MTYPSEVTDAEILSHIANSCGTWVNGEELLEFGAPWVDGDKLRITVYDVHDEQPPKQWVLRIDATYP
jgi:hypothetical protein